MAAVAATAAADPLLREVTELVRAAVAKVCPQGLGVLEDPKAAVGFRPAYLSKPGAAVADLECKAPSLIFWRLRAGGKRKRPRSRSPSPGAGPEPSPGASSDLVAISSAQGAASDVDLEGLTERIVEAMDTAIVTRLLAGVHHRDHGSAKGTIVMVSRRANLRAAAAGFLLCGACGRFAKGETGLWWHVMKAHLSSVVDAKETAARASEAIQLYDAAAGRHTWHAASMEPPLAPAEEVGLAARASLAAPIPRSPSPNLKPSDRRFEAAATFESHPPRGTDRRPRRAAGARRRGAMGCQRARPQWSHAASVGRRRRPPRRRAVPRGRGRCRCGGFADGAPRLRRAQCAALGVPQRPCGRGGVPGGQGLREGHCDTGRHDAVPLRRVAG
uniref:Uncharacterized protein n=1 Tax=Phaeomonas parva TaxID=124430 RepID=A0A7S1XMX0_9STRA|mmetsp:Transcript_23022/g.71622  ORF Transcript_23022/g.71622 Transcript_23022/m.71622 type:complete len:387 (+) Transcript_23022:194-1354(+)